MPFEGQPIHLTDAQRDDLAEIAEGRSAEAGPGRPVKVECMPSMPPLTELIERAPWHEAVTWRETWPHEYVFVRRDNQRPLMEAICKRLTDGEGVDGRFYGRSSTYLFIGEHKYWVMTPCTEMDLDSDDDYIINRARLYRDRRDFVVE